jgi:hypothetical protein
VRSPPPKCHPPPSAAAGPVAVGLAHWLGYFCVVFQCFSEMPFPVTCHSRGPLTEQPATNWAAADGLVNSVFALTSSRSGLSQHTRIPFFSASCLRSRTFSCKDSNTSLRTVEPGSIVTLRPMHSAWADASAYVIVSGNDCVLGVSKGVASYWVLLLVLGSNAATHSFWSAFTFNWKVSRRLPVPIRLDTESKSSLSGSLGFHFEV